MAKRTRIFLLAAGGVLVAGLATALVAWAIGAPVLAALDSNVPAELVYVPDTARMVGFADVRTVMNSEFHDRFRQFQRSNPSGTGGLEAQTGISVERDVDRVLMATAAGATAPSRADRTLLVVSGRFDEPKIESFMRGRGAQVANYRGKKLVSVMDGSTDVALAFAETGLVLFGNRDFVSRGLDAKAGAAADISANADFMRLLAGVVEGTAWTVAQFDSLTSDTAFPGELAERLPPIKWLAGSVRVDSGLHGLLRAETPDEQSAQNLRDVVQGFLALARLQASRRPEFRGVLDSLMLSGEGKSVTFSFDLSASVLDLLTSGGALRPPATPRPNDQPPAAPPVF
jgi:hypothetical protein